jgi:hypothetical protein
LIKSQGVNGDFGFTFTFNSLTCVRRNCVRYISGVYGLEDSIGSMLLASRFSLQELARWIEDGEEGFAVIERYFSNG